MALVEMELVCAKPFEVRLLHFLFHLVAQWIEHLTTDQKVRGSNPCGRTKRFERKIELLI